MIALSTTSITAIETVSAASATGNAAASAMPDAEQRHHRQRVAEEEREHDGERDRLPVAPAERGTDDHAEHLADRAAGQAVHGGAEGDAIQAGRHMPAAALSVSPA